MELRVQRGKWAFLIGINQYEHVRKLKYCANDIIELTDVLQKYLDFPRSHIFDFSDKSDKQPESPYIYHAIGEFCQEKCIQPDDLLLFYFSGHGMIEKTKNVDYLLPIKASPFDLERTGMNYLDIVRKLKKTGCKNIVMFIDACREVIEGERGIGSFGNDSKSVASREGIITFFSCDPKDYSYEIDELEHGSFTHCVLEAIKDPDCITIDDINNYLRENVPIINANYRKPAQQPYTIVEPLDKTSLEVFSSITQTTFKEEYINTLTNKLGDQYFFGALDEITFNKAIAIIDQYKSGTRDELLERKIKEIEKLCEGKLGCTAFGVALEAIERHCLSGPAPSQRLESIE